MRKEVWESAATANCAYAYRAPDLPPRAGPPARAGLVTPRRGPGAIARSSIRGGAQHSSSAASRSRQRAGASSSSHGREHITRSPTRAHTATLEPAEHARVPPRRVRRSGPQLLSRTSLPTAPVPAPLLPPEPCFSRPYPAYPETPAPHTLRTACTSMRMGSCEHEDGQLALAAAWHLRTPPEARSVSAATSRLVG